MKIPKEIIYNKNEPEETEKSETPTSIWQALISVPDEQWDAICEDLFPGEDPEDIMPEIALDEIMERDKCKYERRDKVYRIEVGDFTDLLVFKTTSK